jgi:hypothetical protein
MITLPLKISASTALLGYLLRYPWQNSVQDRVTNVAPSHSRVVGLGGSFAGMSSSRVQYMTLRGTNPTKLPMPCTTCLSTTKSVGQVPSLQQSCRVYGSNQVHGSRGPRFAHPSVSFLSFPFATSRFHAFFKPFTSQSSRGCREGSSLCDLRIRALKRPLRIRTGAPCMLLNISVCVTG